MVVIQKHRGDVHVVRFGAQGHFAFPQQITNGRHNEHTQTQKGTTPFKRGILVFPLPKQVADGAFGQCPISFVVVGGHKIGQSGTNVFNVDVLVGVVDVVVLKEQCGKFIAVGGMHRRGQQGTTQFRGRDNVVAGDVNGGECPDDLFGGVAGGGSADGPCSRGHGRNEQTCDVTCGPIEV